MAVHPRVCGELSRSDLSSSRPAGSSPRVRGTRSSGHWPSGARRFIPACAGNSPRLHRSSARRTVHPRVCGELECERVLASDSLGSSPRVRGTHPVARRRRPGVRFIPACAGNSYPSGASLATMSVHPRVCGELGDVDRLQAPVLRFIPACAGNSGSALRATARCPVHPRVCGELRGAAGAGFRRRRFIPACAGNSPPG